MQIKHFLSLFFMFLNIFPSVAVRPILLCLSQTFMQSRNKLQRTWERSKGAAVTPALFSLPLPHCQDQEAGGWIQILQEGSPSL